jgi:hypothetical protein
MGHVILLSELERARPTRLRGPLPEGGATISLFLGVRYQRGAMEHEAATPTGTALVAVAPRDEAPEPMPACSVSTGSMSSAPAAIEPKSRGPRPRSPGGQRGR